MQKISHRPIVRDLPPSREYGFLRMVAVMVFGTGLRWRWIYPANVVIAIVMMAGCGCAVANFTYGWYFYNLPKVKDFGRKAVAGLSFRWSCDYIFLFIAVAALAQTTVLIHRSARRKLALELGDPVRFMLPATTDNSTSPKQANGAGNAVSGYVVNILTGISVLSGGVLFMFLLLRTLILQDKPFVVENPFSRQHGALALSYLFGVWVMPLVGVWLTVFYATADDLVAMCNAVKQQYTGPYRCEFSRNDCVPLLSFHEKCLPKEIEEEKEDYEHILATFENLKSHIDASFSTTKLWFSCHMIASFLGVLLFALFSFIYLYLSSSTQGKFQYPSEYHTDLFAAFLFLCCYLFPLHGAARVNNSWDDLVRSVLMNPALIRRHPREYSSMCSYLTRVQGGVTAFGYRVEHAAGLKVITLLFTLAGLARSL